MIEAKVIPFAQGADFLHARGMKLKRSGQWLDALDLLRRAQESAADGADYRMDIAAVYADMECWLESRAMTLLHIFGRENAPEAYFQLAKYDTEIGALPEAEKAYELYLHQSPQGAAREEAQAELEDIRSAYGMWRKLDRRTRRQLRRLRQVRRLQAEKDFAGADDLFAKELNGRQGDVQMCVNRAMNLCLMADFAAAKRVIDSVQPQLEEYPSGILILAAQVYHRIGETVQADRLLALLQKNRMTAQDWQMLMALQADMGRNEEAYASGMEALQLQPYDRRMLHLMAVTAVRLGKPQDAAARCWQKILRLNPADEVAQFYLNRLMQGELSEDMLYDGYVLPPKERIRRSSLLLEMLDMPRDQVKQAWARSDVRHALHWALNSETPSLVQPAIRLLAAIDEKESVAELAEFIARTHQDMEIRLYAAQAIRESRWKNWPGVDAYLRLQLIPGMQEALDQLPLPFRQMVRMAQEDLLDEYDLRAGAAPALQCAKHLDSCAGEFNSLLDLRCGAAALTAIELQARGKKDDLRRIARRFGCSERKLKYYLQYLGDRPEEKE